MVTKKIHVKKHNRHGTVVEAHDREVEVTENNTLTDKIKEEKSNKAKKRIIDSLFEGET